MSRSIATHYAILRLLARTFVGRVRNDGRPFEECAGHVLLDVQLGQLEEIDVDEIQLGEYHQAVPDAEHVEDAQMLL